MSELNDRNKALVTELFGLINKMGNDDDIALAIVDHLKTEHKTLQQGFWRVVRMTAGEWVASNPATDLRNESSLRFAKEIEASNEFMPFI